MMDRLDIGRLKVPDETRRRLHLEEDVRELQVQLAAALEAVRERGYTVQAQAREIAMKQQEVRDLYEKLARAYGGEMDE